MNIVIVDDSPSISLFLTRALEEESHRITVYSSGEDAVAAYVTHPQPDLIIMDVELPGIDGFETTKQIRAIEKDNWCPIVYLSSHAEEKLIERGINAGGDSYLTKPIRLLELKSMIKALERIADVRKNLTRSNETLNSILNTATNGIYITDDDGYILSMNASGCSMLGVDEQSVIGTNITTISADTAQFSTPALIKRHIIEVVQKTLGVRREVELRRKSGTTFPAEISTNFVADEDGGIYVGIFHDISERKAYENELKQSRQKLKAMNEQLRVLSYVDGLTKIHNRRSFDEAIRREFQQARRDGTELSVILCDIDHFKSYNDTYGHQLGDDALIKVAHTIKSSPQRPSDLAARYGGEEFIILLPQTDAKGAQFVAEKTRNSVIKLAIPNSNSSCHQYVTISLGIATIRPTKNCSIENLIKMADDALYSAKKKGRNNVQPFDAAS